MHVMMSVGWGAGGSGDPDPDIDRALLIASIAGASPMTTLKTKDGEPIREANGVRLHLDVLD